MRSLILAALAALLLSTGCQAYNVKSDQSYNPSSVPFGVYDIYTPKGPPFSPAPPPGGYPVIIGIHGGAWEGGNKTDMGAFADEFCSDGYVIVAPNYRLSTDGPNWKAARWPAQIADVQSAINFVWSNAAVLGVNRDKMATLGVSAGGHLATMAALRDDPSIPPLMFLHPKHPKVAVDLDGEMDMTVPGEKCMSSFAAIMSNVSGIAGVSSAQWNDPAQRTPAMQTVCKDISPVFFARPDVNLFICHGESDDNVYVANAGLIEAAVLAAGGKVEKHIITGKAGFCHGKCWQDPSVLPYLHKFLDANLK